jgi:hypothetical protein
MPQDIEKEKPRKPESAERFDEADNNGRFAGNDPDAQSAREQVPKNTASQQSRSNTDDIANQESSDLLARRDNQSHNYKGEADNVNDDTGRSLNEEELQHQRNKQRDE